MNDGVKGASLRLISALSVCLLFTFGVHAFRSHSRVAPDFQCKTSNAEIVVHISAGDTGFRIAQMLKDAGVIKSTEAYFRVAVGDKRSNRVAPGNHRLSKRNCALETLNQLLDPKRITGLIVIQEGMWNSEVFPQMIAAGFLKNDIQLAVSKIKLPKGFTVLEGLLFPAQYSFDKNTSAENALQLMVVRAEQEMRNVGFNETKNGMTPQKLLIIASLIQAEGLEKDFQKVSRVIYNRLEKGMPLQFDTTVHFIKKSRGKIFLSTNSTFIKSPYNTYRRIGLPPGPINNPGISAMKAALNPESGNWLYFITIAPGDTRFTDNLDEFNKLKIEYKKNLRAGKFRSNS